MMLRFVLALLCAGASVPALAHTILISNDDGLTSNVRALYLALKAEGHDVVVSVPCSGQSGMGGAIVAMRPLAPLAADCLNAAARKGDPGAGAMTRPGFERDFHYVDGTPVMATLYGIDIVAVARWGRPPDLVISGPNEGQNLGHIVVSSGTVSNVQYAVSRGIPAIAVSAGEGTADNPGLANPESAVVAQRTVELVSALARGERGQRLLPPGVALNVNFPDRLVGAKWKLAEVGSYDFYKLRFVEKPASGDAAGETGVRPVLLIEINQDAPLPGQERDESVIARTDIAVSVLQAGYGHDAPGRKTMRARLRGLIGR